jgi:hypothetical protein
MNADEKISQNDLSISACTHGRAAMHLRVEELGWILPESSLVGVRVCIRSTHAILFVYIFSRFVLALVDGMYALQ